MTKKPAALMSPMLCEFCDNEDPATMFVYSGVWLNAGTLEPASEFEVDEPDPEAGVVCRAEVEYKDGTFGVCNYRDTLAAFREAARKAKAEGDGK